MLTLENAWPLMDGGQAPKEVVMVRVKALRGFWIEGRLATPGTVVEIDSMLASELIHSQKVEVTKEESDHGTAAKVDSGEGAENVQSVGDGRLDAGNGEPR
jgi:hypothetical protein